MSEIKPSSDEAQAQRHERQLRSAMLPGMLLAFAGLLAGLCLYHLDFVSQNIGGAIGFIGGGLGLLLTFAGFRRASRLHPPNHALQRTEAGGGASSEFKP